MFWDSSAIIPLCVDELRTKVIKNIVKKDDSMVAWWGSPVECFSAFARLRRDNFLSASEEDRVRQLIHMLSTSWTQIEPSHKIFGIWQDDFCVFTLCVLPIPFNWRLP